MFKRQGLSLWTAEAPVSWSIKLYRAAEGVVIKGFWGDY